MTDNEFNLYMKKFEDRYFIKIDEDNTRIIEANQVKIAPYDPENQFLGVWGINLSPWLKKSILRRLNPVFIEVHQDCDNEFGAYFHEKHLDEVCRVIKAKKRPKLSDEERQKRAMLAKINFRSNRDE